jgi:chemotaxis protein methyltransferase CheR
MDRRNSLAHAIVATVREPLIVLDRNLRVVAASRSFYKIFQKEPTDTLGRPFLTTGERDELRRLLEDVISGDKVIEAYEIELDLPDIGRRRLLLNARLVLDQKSADTALLVALEDVTARREAEGLKDALLKQQETLLLEVQHRIGNSLQIIASILLLKARNVQSEETRSHLRDAHQRLLSVATVQEQLRASPLGERIEVGPYLEKLCASLASSMISDERPITVTASSTGGTANSNDAVSYGLIVTELVINAKKHAYPASKGQIRVGLRAINAHSAELSVEDDGIGSANGASTPKTSTTRPRPRAGTAPPRSLSRSTAKPPASSRSPIRSSARTQGSSRTWNRSARTWIGTAEVAMQPRTLYCQNVVPGITRPCQHA